jgi:hypothetical protein
MSTQTDEDITNMDTPIVVAYHSKVKLFFSISIINTCDEWTQMNTPHDMCSMSFHLQKYIHRSKKVWIMHGKDGL